MISADLDELIGMSDRLAVILRGRLVSYVDPKSVTPQDLGSAMTGAGEDSPSNDGPGEDGPSKDSAGENGPAEGVARWDG